MTRKKNRPFRRTGWGVVLLVTTVFLAIGGCSSEPDPAGPSGDGGLVTDVRGPGATAGHLTGLGRVLGAVVDADLQRLYLVGEPAGPGSSLDSALVAAALLSAEGEAPYLSIDPIEGDLEGPWMTVRVSPGVENTRLGWTMFEADRLLKSYSLGADTVTRFPILSGVTGFKDSFTLALEGSEAGSAAPVWSRFWLRPREARVHQTADAIDIVEASMMVDTEVMAVQDGKLVSAPSTIDEGAEQFATFFTEHYAELGAEARIFVDLEQILRLIVLGKWVAGEGIEIDRAWLVRHANVRFPMPRVTPSLSGTLTRTTETADAISELTVSLHGGVSFADLDLEAVDDGEDLASHRDDLRAAADAAVSPNFTIEIDGQPRAGFWVPLTGNEADPTVAPILEVPLGDDPPLTLYAESDPATGAYGQPILPTLSARTILEGDSYEVVSLGDVAVPVRIYELFGARGDHLGRFESHEVDQDRGELTVLPVDSSSEYRLYLPTNDAIVATGPDGLVLVFSAEDGKVREELVGETVVQFDYAEGGALERISSEDGEELVRFELGSNGSRALAGTVVADNTVIELAPPAPGTEPVTLTAANEGGQQFTVTVQPGTADWSSDGPATGLEYLTERGPEILTRLASGEARPFLVPNGALTVLLEGDTLRLIPFPVTAHDQIADALARSSMDAILGIVPADSGQTAVLTNDGGELVVELFAGDGRAEVLRGEAARLTFQRAEAEYARSLSTDELQFLSLLDVANDTSTVALCADREQTLDAAQMADLADLAASVASTDPLGTNPLSEVMSTDTAYVVAHSATWDSAPPATFDAHAVAHDVRAVAEQPIFSDHKYLRATINFKAQRTVRSADVDVSRIGSAALRDATEAAATVAADHGLASVEYPSARPRHVIVTDLDDESLRDHFASSSGGMRNSGVILLRVGHGSNQALYTRLMQEHGLRYLLDHEVALDTATAGLIVRALAEVLDEAGEPGLEDALVFRSAVQRGLDAYDLSEEERLTWYRLWRRTLLKLSAVLPPRGGPADPAASRWTATGRSSAERLT